MLNYKRPEFIPIRVKGNLEIKYKYGNAIFILVSL